MYKLKRIKMFEDVAYNKLEEQVNTFLKSNKEKTYGIIFKTSTVKDDKGLDMLIYTMILKEMSVL